MTWALLLALPATGCYRTHFHVQRGKQAMLSDDYDGRWHHDGIFGLVEFSDPVPLARACPGGVARMTRRRACSTASSRW